MKQIAITKKNTSKDMTSPRIVSFRGITQKKGQKKSGSKQQFTGPVYSRDTRFDPTKMKDWQIAEAAEQFMKPVAELAQELGLKTSELPRSKSTWK